mmetsp:Transcript_2746/g.6655  ORF Transcript_2746/g.6655 Transcript_2746/m.6655 type:complete len:218 (-) Transcript_2746:107-760(-)
MILIDVKTTILEEQLMSIAKVDVYRCEDWNQCRSQNQKIHRFPSKSERIQCVHHNGEYQTEEIDNHEREHDRGTDTERDHQHEAGVHPKTVDKEDGDETGGHHQSQIAWIEGESRKRWIGKIEHMQVIRLHCQTAHVEHKFRHTLAGSIGKVQILKSELSTGIRASWRCVSSEEPSDHLSKGRHHLVGNRFAVTIQCANSGLSKARNVRCEVVRHQR